MILSPSKNKAGCWKKSKKASNRNLQLVSYSLYQSYLFCKGIYNNVKMCAIVDCILQGYIKGGFFKNIKSVKAAFLFPSHIIRHGMHDYRL